jgi:hypothetical protein
MENFFLLEGVYSVYYMLEMECNALQIANVYNSVMDTADCKINLILEHEEIKNHIEKQLYKGYNLV